MTAALPGWTWSASRVAAGRPLFTALLVTISNFVVDLAYTWLDPRVKYS